MSVSNSLLFITLFIWLPVVEANVTLQIPEQLFQQAEQQLAQGHIYTSLPLLDRAYISSSDQPALHAAIAATKGEAFFRLQKNQQAEHWLMDSLQQAKKLSQPSLLSAIYNRLGHLKRQQNQPLEAISWYQQGQQYAQQSNDHTRLTVSHINLSRVDKDKVKQHLADAYLHWQQIDNSVQQAHLSLVLGVQLIILQPERAQFLLQNTLQLTKISREKSQALGYLAQLAKTRQQSETALELLQQAIVADPSVDLRMRWESKRGKLWQQQGKIEAALHAYQRALGYLQQIKADIPLQNLDGESPFRILLTPIYRGLADLLLQQSSQYQGQEQQLKLRQVQSLWEQFKAAELQDYFRDACTVEQRPRTLWQTLDKNSAIIYPILLDDRIELLLGFHDHIERFSVAVNYDQLRQTLHQLEDNLRDYHPLQNNQQLYKWLLKPLENSLEKHHVHTLVYLPDGALRTIPLALLHDGENYLIENYAVVTIPALSLLSVDSSPKLSGAALLTGISNPGSVVDELLSLNIGGFIDDNRSLRSHKSGIQQQNRSNLQEQLKLPGVTKELQLLSQLLSSPILENHDFTFDRFQQEIRKEYNIVHIASHGFFSGNPDKSFIMSYDHLITMKQLSQLLQSQAFHINPIDLISLSACQTAEGDDRSPLGLSGIIIQAGVNSAIGTLWPVADSAAQQFFSEFYRLYLLEKESKAEALRKAQLKILQQPEFDHPALWAPFILIGQWH